MKMNLPNRLTIIRMCLVPVYVIFYLALPYPVNNWLSLIVFTAASLTDLADGKIARARGEITTFGKFMDPLADKILVGSALICFVETKMMPAWVVVILISREFIVSGLRLVAAGKGRVIAAGWWGKVKTATQMTTIILLLIPIPGAFWRVICWIFIIASVFFSILSIIDYFVRNGDVLEDTEE